jgi:protein-S-isoprenylcysteine O-methyltransferase Ste14
MRSPEVFHDHPALTALWIATYILCIVPEIVLSKRLRSEQDAQKLDRGTKLAVIVAANLAVVLGFISAVWFPAFSVGTHWKTAFAAGIVIWLGGIIFCWYAIRTLGRFFTYDVAISSGQQVVERGPYRWLRHPSYLGSLLGELGFGMTLTNWLAIIIPPLCLGVVYLYRIHIEEQALSQGLGTPYREHMRRTWRLIPYVF